MKEKKKLKQVKINEELWRTLMRTKLDGNFSSIDATLEYLFNNTRRLKELLK